MSIIACKDISKRFGNKVALDKVSIEVPQGGIYGLLGPNGAGKTTLIRIINRITIQGSGTVLFNGRPITRQDVARIGYLPEERGLYRKMQVGDQAMYLARLKGMSQSDARAALKDWFGRFGIMDWWEKKVEELSKGMAQKVQFITTVVHRPSLMILDEPFSGFDPVNADLIRKEILRLRDEGATVILSTHNMESVEELCDNIALINHSRLVLEGPVEAIRRSYGDDSIEVLHSSAVPLESREGLFTVISDTADSGLRRAVLQPREGATTNSVISSLLAGGLELHGFRELMPGMNDIFIKLVKGNI